MPNRRVARQRKNATSHQGTSKGINLKRRRLCDSSESESKQDAQESRPKRKLARCVTYEDSKMVRLIRKLKKGPWILKQMTCLHRHLRRLQNWNRTLTIRMSWKKRTMNKRRNQFRRRSQNLEEQKMERCFLLQVLYKHSQKRKQNNYTEEQREILQAMLCETHHPSEEQKKNYYSSNTMQCLVLNFNKF
ncbi:hypothetical protein L3Y34_011384 [Caenorhabditis briggsae]|uniref:Uncharacterized protein n=1 Tax=Caenorhabditis briggsae TaxID=6238 RepID=A0AAE8ZR78_CAEBR|nr:hypothetical protein L3Y34_011384 [Caenorhabditis briggsae]